MPKIPLYAQGQGTAVELATGRLGPKAPSAAFEAPGQAVARAGEALGRAGTSYAQNAMRFEDARKKLEFDFQMKQKQEQTRNLTKKYEAAVFAQSQDYILKNTESDPFKAAENLARDVYTPLTSEIDALDVTDSQKTAIKGAVFNKFAYQHADIKKSAFNLDRIQSGQTTNDTLAATLSEIGTMDNLTDANAKIAEGVAAIRDAAVSGETGVAFGEKGFVQEALRVFFNGAIKGSDSFATLATQESLIEKQANLSDSNRTLLLSAVKGRRNEIKDNLEDTIRGQLLTSNLTEAEYASAFDQLTTKGNTKIVVERENDDNIVIAFGGADFAFLTGVANKLRTEKNILESENNQKFISRISVEISDMNRNELTALVEDAYKNRGEFAGVPVEVRDNIIGRVEERLLGMDQELRDNVSAQTEAIRNVFEATKGETTPGLATLISDTQRNLQLLGDSQDLKNFDNTIDGLTRAKVIFGGLTFSTEAEVSAAILDLNNKIAQSGGDVDEIEALQTAKETLSAMVQARKADIERDPVAYIQTNRLPEQELATVSELLSIQRKMGIAPVDFRIATNDQISQFKMGFDDPEKSYEDKANFGKEFIDSFGVENRDIVMRHLMNSGVFGSIEQSLAASWLLANPTNVLGFSIEAANKPEMIEKLQTLFGSAAVKEVEGEIRTANASYTSSITGGMADSQMSLQATPQRTMHTIAMNGVVRNVALYFMQEGTSAKEAVKKAINIVVDSQFTFESVNNKTVRFPKSFSGSSEEIGNMLKFFVSDRQVINRIAESSQVPPLSGQSADAAKAQFVKELKGAYWTTSSNHQSVYLVDKTGNMIQREIDPTPMGRSRTLSPEQAFYIIKFSDLVPLIDEIENVTNVFGGSEHREKEILRRFFK
tara:strand:- start:4665 stop:7325 length:2661 start_codon:yes stop_codon:yes gene_type:complete